jgi:ATP-binding cassette subfamily B multidrug efflux pump
MNPDFLNEDTYDKSLKDGKSFLFLLKFAKDFRYQFIFALCLMFTSSGISIFSARLMGRLVEEGLIGQDASKAWSLAIFIFLLEMTSIGLIWSGRYILAQAATKTILLIRQSLFHHIHALPMKYFDRQPQGRTVTRMSYDVESMEEFFTSSMGRILQSLITFFIAIIAMCLTDFKLGFYLILSMTPAIFLTIYSRKMIRIVNRDMSKFNSACNAKLSEYLNGLSVIRSFGLEKWALDNYFSVIGRHRQSQLRANTYYAWSRPLINFLCMMPLILLFLIGGRAVLLGTLGVGVFVSFIRYCERFSFPLANITREIHVIQQAFTSAERVTSFLKASTEDDEFGVNGDQRPKHLTGKIVFDHVSMSYDLSKPVLKDINFVIQAGEKIGLAGTTGSGKTSTVSLLARLYEFQTGDIYFDDLSIRKIERQYLRSLLGFVSQEVVLFRGTLRENLTCEAEVSDLMIEEACLSTGLLSVMSRNGINLNSEVLENGSNLSTGEKQLVSLTRVLLKDPLFLILDEATANVDPEYEKIIHQAIDKVMKNRTCLLIAHRLDSLKSCDRILVFDQGTLVEQGSHEELMLKRDYYFQLHLSGHQKSDHSSSSLI